MTNGAPALKRLPVKIIIVDDHPAMRSGLERAFEYEDDLVVVGMGDKGQDALDLAQQLQPQLILLDVNLPDINGIQVAKQLKSQHPQLRIIIITAYHELAQIIHAIRAGAVAYCNKDIDPAELVSVVRDVIKGYHVIENKRLNQEDLQVWVETRIAHLTGPYIADADEHYIPLSRREHEILEHVTHGYSNKAIAHRLGISQQTVKNHMTSILKKLNVEDRTQAAVTAIRRGWVRIHEPGQEN